MAEKILITGAAGFIGSHLTELCIEKGFSVRAFVHYNSRNTWGWLEQSKYLNQIEVISGDIRDYDSVAAAVKGCDWVFHLAALIGIPYSYVSPQAYIRTNIEGTYNILQSAKEFGLNQVLITSTSETYGTAQYVPIDENHPLAAQSPYSASKIGADHLALSYHHSFDLPVKIVRPFNTYGPRQSARAVIPTIITQILSGQQTIRLGNIFPTRDLTFVKDTANGFIEIAKSDRLFGQVTNIGMGRDISIGDLTNLIADILKVDIKIETDKQRVRPDSSEVERLCCKNTKLLENTGWKPQFDLRSGLGITIDWIRANLNNYKSQLYNI